MKITINKIKQIADRVLANKYAGLTESEIEKVMKDYIDDSANDVILSALGLEKHWGEVRFKYDSVFGKMMNKIKENSIYAVAQNVVNELFDNAKISFSEKEKKALRSAYRESYLEELEDRLRDLAKEQALIDYPGVFEEYMKSQEEVAQ